MNPNKAFVIRTNMSDYAMGAVFEQTDEKGHHYPVTFWSNVLTPSQRKSWTRTTKQAYAIVSALRKWSGHIALQPVCVCTDHQPYKNWHTECVGTPSGPDACVDGWHVTFSKFNLRVVYVPGKDNTIADVLSPWVDPSGRALQDVSIHRDAKEMEVAKRPIALSTHWEEGMIDPEVKCFVVQLKGAPTAHMICSVVASVRTNARQSAPSVPPVFSADTDVVTQDWGRTYAKSPDFSGHFNLITSAPEGGERDGDHRPKDVTVHGHRFSKAAVYSCPKAYPSSWCHNGTRPTPCTLGAKSFDSSELRNICKRVCASCTVYQAQNPANYKAPGNSQFYRIPGHSFESVCIDIIFMPALTVEELGTKGSTSTPFDTILLFVDRHSGYIVAAATTKEELTGQRAARLNYHNWFTVLGPPHELMSNKGSAFVSSWFNPFCQLQGVQKTESVAYLSSSNGRAENAGQQSFDKLAKLHQESKVNWYEGHSWALPAYHELPGPTGVSPHVAVFGRDFTSTPLPWHQRGLALDADEFVAKLKELHRLNSESLRRKHAASDERKDYTVSGADYKNGDAVWLLRPCPVAIHRFKSRWTPAVGERRIGPNTYYISRHRGLIKAAHSSQPKHPIADLTGARVDLSYTDEKLSAEDGAQEDDYLVNRILRHGPKPGSPDPDDIDFLVP